MTTQPIDCTQVAPCTFTGEVSNVQPLSDAPPLMPQKPERELMASGDLGAMITAMLLESGKEARKSARAAKDAAGAAEDAAFERKIEDMKDAADARFAAGLGSAGGTGLSGVVTMVSPFSRDTANKGSAASIDALGKGGSVWATEVASQQDREVEKAERCVKQAGRSIESANDADKDAKELIEKALQFYAEYANGQNDMKKAALFRT